MGNLFIVVLALSCVVQSQGWLYIVVGNKTVLEGHPNQCYYKEVGYMNVNEEKNIPNECVRVTCRANGSVILAGCGTQTSRSACTITKGDPSKPYPECCPIAECK